MKKRLEMPVRILIAFCLAFFARSPLWADTGWVEPDSWSGGSVYSEKENPDIAMEDEAIIAIPDGDYMRFTVHFRFRNTSNRSVETSVGFPVVNRISAPFGLERSGPELIMQGVLFDRLMKPGDQGHGPVLDMLTSIDGKRRDLPWNRFLEEAERQRVSLQIGRDSVKGQNSIGIVHNGAEVQVERVILQGKASNRTSTYAGSGGEYSVPRSADVIVNYMFRLVFPPNAVSTLTVDYKVYAVAAGGKGEVSYRSDYVIGTGRTWKGPIGAIYGVGPVVWEAKDGEGNRVTLPGEVYKGTLGNPWSLLVAKNVEPDAGLRLSVSPGGSGNVSDYLDSGTRKSIDSAAPVSGEAGLVSVYPGVLAIGASSIYGGTTNVVVPDSKRAPVLLRSTYGPAALFDGVMTNAWVEGVKGPGINEHADFELTTPAFGATFYNGLRMLPPSYDYPDPDVINTIYGGSPTADRLAPIWGMNNRVKQLSISVPGSGTPVLSAVLKDDWHGGTYKAALEPGTYSVTILSVYKGTKWDDTCLGEIVLHTIPRLDLLSAGSPELWGMVKNSLFAPGFLGL